MALWLRIEVDSWAALFNFIEINQQKYDKDTHLMPNMRYVLDHHHLFIWRTRVAVWVWVVLRTLYYHWATDHDIGQYFCLNSSLGKKSVNPIGKTHVACVG